MSVSLQNDGDGMTNVEIIQKAKSLKLPNFRYFMSNELSGRKASMKECGVLNLDDSTGPGTHHVCFWKDGKSKCYFDSFGVVPPTELINYLGRPITYSTHQIQDINDTNCSELCLHVLSELSAGKKFTDVVLNMLK